MSIDQKIQHYQDVSSSQLALWTQYDTNQTPSKLYGEY